MRKLLLLSLLAAGLYACTDSADTGGNKEEVTTDAAEGQGELDWKENAFPEYLRAAGFYATNNVKWV